MEPEHLRFGGGSSATLLHPLVAIGVLLGFALILYLPRKSIIIPLLLGLMLTPRGQVVVLAGIHFNVYRILILAALTRWMILRRSAPLAGGFTFMDRVVTLWAVSLLICFSAQWMESQAIIKALGDFLDNLGGYFVLRFSISNMDDSRRAVKILAVIALINALCMINEQRTGVDLFAQLGGLPPETVRGGHIRSQGAFEVYILAGTFGATMFPLFLWLWSQGKCRIMSTIGMISAAIMTYTCYASTTLGAFGAGILALFFWPLRRQMRYVRWGLALTTIGLHLVMKGPVWSLIEHIDLTGSSESYHRYQLVDTFIRHFSDWWLWGTSSNASWGWMMHDLSNAYVMNGINGGLATFILFIAVISRGFGRIGRCQKLTRSRQQQWFLWCLGASMFSNVVSYFGIGYFDQMQFAWFVLLSIISVAVFDVTSARSSTAITGQALQSRYPKQSLQVNVAG